MSLSDPLVLAALLILAALAGAALGRGLASRRHAPRAAGDAAPGERERYQALLRLAAQFAEEGNLDDQLNQVLAMLAEAADADHASLYLISPDSERLVVRAVHARGQASAAAVTASPFPRGEGLAGWVIEHQEPAVIPDLAQDARWLPSPQDATPYRSALAVPLTVGGERLGALLLLGLRARGFPADALELAAAAGRQIAAALNNARVYRLVREQTERMENLERELQTEIGTSRAVLESLAEGVLITDAGHHVVWYNAAAERLLRLSRQAVIGRPVVDLIGLYGPAGHRWAEALQAWSQQPPQAEAQATLEERLAIEDQRVVSVRVAPIVLDNAFRGTASIFRDITGEQQVDRLKADFVATVTHELRTPMTAIRGYVQILLMEAPGPLNTEQRRFMEVIKGNADRLGDLLNDLLDISRLESGKVELSLKELDPRLVLSAARSYIDGRCQQESKPMRLRSEAADDLPTVRADPERLHQILVSLLDNSFNYTPVGGQISLTARRSGDAVAFEVADNGIGIPAADQERIFERFFRGEQALNLGVAGIGLGLSVAAQLVAMHGGRLQVSSSGEPGQGSVFTFTLPIAGGPA